MPLDMDGVTPIYVVLAYFRGIIERCGADGAGRMTCGPVWAWRSGDKIRPRVENFASEGVS